MDFDSVVSEINVPYAVSGDGRVVNSMQKLVLCVALNIKDVTVV